MPRMDLPILNILRSQSLIPDHQQVLRILFLCRLGEIEAPGDHNLPINDQDFIMGDGVGGVNLYADIEGEVRAERALPIP